MGRVFTWQEIEEGKIPRLRDFPVVASRIQNQLTKTKGVQGAVICGSVLFGTHNHRSDVDCVIVYDLTHKGGVMRVLSDLITEAHRMHVPVEFIPTDMHLAVRGSHSIGASFAEHLKVAAARGGLIKEDPLKFFCLDGFSAPEDAKNYIRIKRQKIEKGSIRMVVMEDCQQYHFLQKALEAPFHAIRKLLFAKGTNLADDSKGAVVDAFMKFANTNEANILSTISKIDHSYTLGLGQQVEKKNQSEYLQVMREVKSLIPAIIEFLRLCAIRIP